MMCVIRHRHVAGNGRIAAVLRTTCCHGLAAAATIHTGADQPIETTGGPCLHSRPSEGRDKNPAWQCDQIPTDDI